MVDASGKTLGRLASQIAHRLKGKHKADYSPHVDMGDHIVVLNAEKIAVTGNKLDDKFYHHHTGYLGNLKSIALGKLLQGAPGARASVCGQGHAAEEHAGPQHVSANCMCSPATSTRTRAQQPKPLEL